MQGVRGWLRRRQAARARAWIRETGALRYPDGSVKLPQVELVFKPCAACGGEVLCDPDEENPIHLGECPVKPWLGPRNHGLTQHGP